MIKWSGSRGCLHALGWRSVSDPRTTPYYQLTLGTDPLGPFTRYTDAQTQRCTMAGADKWHGERSGIETMQPESSLRDLRLALASRHMPRLCLPYYWVLVLCTLGHLCTTRLGMTPRP